MTGCTVVAMDIWRPVGRAASVVGMRNALLLAEPEDATRDFLERHLRDDGFEVVETGVNGDALTLAERARPDLVLLAELELCRRLRMGEPGRCWDREVPVILLAPPEADPVDRVRAFDRGADDVVERPFNYEELLARIRAVLRRSGQPRRELLEAGVIFVDRRTRRVTVRGEHVELAGREFELLARLASDPHRVFTKEELLREVWGYRSLGRTRTLDSHASRVRRKLCRVADDRFVVNVWGVGYRLLE
jgi:DNA-binding response OmpR family regulator